MKILFWNARGVANHPTRLVLKNICVSHKPDIVLIAEPWMNLDAFPKMFWTQLGLRPFSVNSHPNLAPNLWCLCRDVLNPTVIASSPQQVSFSVVVQGQELFTSAIYASTSYASRRELWNELFLLQQLHNGPWCFIGDFNAVLGAHETRGGSLPLQVSCEDFRGWTDRSNLTHILTRGAAFTWSNGRRGHSLTEKRLDRVVCNDAWLSFWDSSSCCTLSRSKSDHFPILLTLSKGATTFPSHFKFLSFWTNHGDCRKIITEVWNRPVFGCPMFILMQKLKALKQELKSWNKETVGDVHLNVEKAQAALDYIQAQGSELGYTDLLLEEETTAQVKLHKALLDQEEFWKEKARINWHCQGDRNTAFFHKVAKIRNASKRMSILKNGNVILDKAEDIEQHVLQYYKALFATDNSCCPNQLVEDVIPPLVSAEDNVMLTNLPSREEVKNAVFSLNANGAPGPDGFGGVFYQKYWDIISDDVFNSVLQFFSQGWLLPGLNSNLVVLIPKFPEADTIENYRPIALANFQFKIITKVLADRLATVAPKIISEHQRGFLRNRQISDCICITSEAINLLDKKAFGGNLALKIDIKKAFDTMDWHFLLKVLQTFGFHNTFCNWVKAILDSAKLSISVNGHSVGYFSCKRGVRQGDPLSPLLFCIAEDVLSRAISKLMDSGHLSPMASPKGAPTPSHVLYADDIMIFCRGTLSNARKLMHIFALYGEASGQVINTQKSKFYSGSLTGRRLANISNILGFAAGRLPFTYLGVPIFKGKPKKSHLQPIADKIKAKLAAWKGSLLSIMGRALPVKSIAQSMMIYSFHVYVWPVALLKLVDQWLRNFIWSGDINARKIVTVAWHKICTPFPEGGLGIRPLRKINEAATLKLGWDLIASQCQWANFLKARFFSNGSPRLHHFSSSIWLALKRIIPILKDNSAWQLGDGQNINFWTDVWLPQSVTDIIHAPSYLGEHLTAKVSDFIINRKWFIPPYLDRNFPELAALIRSVPIPLQPSHDQLRWALSDSGCLSFKGAFEHCNPLGQIVPWSKLIWHPHIPPSKSFILWRLLHRRMPTDDNLRSRGCVVVSMCSLCGNALLKLQSIFSFLAPLRK